MTAMPFSVSSSTHLSISLTLCQSHDDRCSIGRYNSLMDFDTKLLFLKYRIASRRTHFPFFISLSLSLTLFGHGHEESTVPIFSFLSLSLLSFDDSPLFSFSPLLFSSFQSFLLFCQKHSSVSSHISFK